MNETMNEPEGTAQDKAVNVRPGARAPGRPPKDSKVMVNRGLAMVGLTVRSIFFDRKTMIVGAILLLLLTIPLLWLRNPSGEDDAAMDFFMGIMVMLYLQFIVLYVCFL